MGPPGINRSNVEAMTGPFEVLTEGKNLARKLLALISAFVLMLAICTAAPVVVAQSPFELPPIESEILNATEQEELIDLVVFAFTIGIIMLVLGFAMGMFMYRGRH